MKTYKLPIKINVCFILDNTGTTEKFDWPYEQVPREGDSISLPDVEFKGHKTLMLHGKVKHVWYNTRNESKKDNCIEVDIGDYEFV